MLPGQKELFILAVLSTALHITLPGMMLKTLKSNWESTFKSFGFNSFILPELGRTPQNFPVLMVKPYYGVLRWIRHNFYFLVDSYFGVFEMNAVTNF